MFFSTGILRVVLLGVLIGTYSSIFIAAPILLGLLRLMQPSPGAPR